MESEIYKLPTWAETILVISVAVMLMGLAIWLGANALKAVLDAEARLEKKRRRTETKALNNWQRLYEEEHQLRADDNAMLIAQLTDLQCENKRMKQIMAKARLIDL